MWLGLSFPTVSLRFPLSQGLMQLRLVSNLLCSQGWTPNFPASTYQVLVNSFSKTTSIFSFLILQHFA